MVKIRRIIYFKSHFSDFFEKQPDRLKSKIDYVLFVISVAEHIPKKFFDHLSGTDGLYEIRIKFRTNIYRIFCCFDEGNIIVLFNGFQKKTQKTPASEIKKALNIKKVYFETKSTRSSHENEKKIN